MKKDELKTILENHKKWLNSEDGGARANLRMANLSGADLSDADLSDADLSRADLSRADLCGADLSGADLSYADLHEANLHEANLSDADLRRADLRMANLSRADLRRADLSGASLRMANLSGADMDYSCWPLWCGSLDVKVDARIARQIAYHFCRLVCDDAEYLAARDAIAEFANGFHRGAECGKIERTNCGAKMDGGVDNA